MAPFPPSGGIPYEDLCRRLRNDHGCTVDELDFISDDLLGKQYVIRRGDRRVVLQVDPHEVVFGGELRRILRRLEIDPEKF